MKKPIRDGMLMFLDAISDGLLLFELNGRYRYAYRLDGRHGIRRLLSMEERRDMNRKLDMARRRGLVSESKIGKRLVFSLTDRGLETLDRKALRATRRRKDGRQVCVMYDIPEKFRASRDRLRVILKRAGFSRYQQSIWRTDRDVASLLKDWIERHKLGKWVDIAVI